MIPNLQIKKVIPKEVKSLAWAIKSRLKFLPILFQSLFPVSWFFSLHFHNKHTNTFVLFPEILGKNNVTFSWVKVKCYIVKLFSVEEVKAVGGGDGGGGNRENKRKKMTSSTISSISLFYSHLQINTFLSPVSN